MKCKSIRVIFLFIITVIINNNFLYSFTQSRREKSKVVYDLWQSANSGDLNDAKKFYIKSLQDHLVLLDKQDNDATAKIMDLGDTIEEKEKEKDKIERNKLVQKSRKRKLKQLIPSFASSDNVEVTRATKQTLCVKSNTVELLDSGTESKECLEDDDDDDDELLMYNLKPASK